MNILTFVGATVVTYASVGILHSNITIKRKHTGEGRESKQGGWRKGGDDYL